MVCTYYEKNAFALKNNL